MKTPICDFVTAYEAASPTRFHMPGHKGVAFTGMEPLDITEISGADDLFHPCGVIAESEAIASNLFGCPTVYSTEGSSLCIRAMLYLAYTRHGCRGAVLAGRNAHKSFLHTAILLDFPIHWLWAGTDYLSCPITPQDVEAAILEEPERPFAVYLTSPDYLGHIADLASISQVCKKYQVPLLVDNAHGAYLKFLPNSLHPMDLGADFCVDSAHKTLPVLTGGAYLHFRDAALIQPSKDAMALFGSTSPSYLILQSLDRCNHYLEDYPQRLCTFLPSVASMKARLRAHGFDLIGDEVLKLTILTKQFGYTGEELSLLLEQHQIFCEFFDTSHLVLMMTPENTADELLHLEEVLLAIPRRSPLPLHPCPSIRPRTILSPRQASFSQKETIPVTESSGRILATAAVGCPPAVPIVMCGELITQPLVEQLIDYGTEFVTVVKDTSAL